MVAIKQKFSYLHDGDIDTDAWLQRIKATYHLDNINLLTKACLLAKTSPSCIEQSLEIAEIILDLKLDQEAVAAAMIANSIQYTPLAIGTITEQLGDGVAKLIADLQQMNAIRNLQKNTNKTRNNVQIDLLRKMLLAMVSDIRVVLIKLAERTCIMRGIKNIALTERKRIAQETMDIYAPLANRLGIGQLKWELEDSAFRYINPEEYQTIAKFLAERRTDREKRIQTIITQLKEKIHATNIQAHISGRAKHIHSIYLKMLRKHVDYKNIYDSSAIRILVPKVDDCYNILSIVHSLWEHIPEEFDDYIAHPKSNGYRSIHTAIIDSDGKNLEIQIRTVDMHEESEHGVAAHWLYKENKTQQSGYETKITCLRQLLDWHKEIAAKDAKPNALLEDRVYVFTPAGDIVDLPKGATPLDFAYHIHSGLGHRCRGAKINGHIVPFAHALQTGDRVEIITAPNGTPSRDWLNKELGYLATARARAKVAQWFRHQDAEHEAVHATHVIQHHEVNRHFTPVSSKKGSVKNTYLQIAGTRDLLTRIAKCCNPIPGDPIIGYITQGRGVSIHKESCSNISHLASKNNNRFIQVSWNKK